MASNRLRLNKKLILQITLILLGMSIIFFTYFYSNKEKKNERKIAEKEIKEIEDEVKNLNTFEDIQYEGEDVNGNKFVINADNAEFKTETSNIINMKTMLCKFYFKDGTVLTVLSDFGVYDNISNDMEFEQNVKMYYLENTLFAEKANYINSKGYLLVQENVIGEAPEGNLAADRLDFDLTTKKLKISMYNEDKVNIKVNY